MWHVSAQLALLPARGLHSMCWCTGCPARACVQIRLASPADVNAGALLRCCDSGWLALGVNACGFLWPRWRLEWEQHTCRSSGLSQHTALHRHASVHIVLGKLRVDCTLRGCMWLLLARMRKHDTCHACMRLALAWRAVLHWRECVWFLLAFICDGEAGMLACGFSAGKCAWITLARPAGTPLSHRMLHCNGVARGLATRGLQQAWLVLVARHCDMA